MGELSPWHWLIVLAAFVLLFGSQRLPQMARSAGQAMRIFKTEIATQHQAQQTATPDPATTDPSPPATTSPPASPPADPPASRYGSRPAR